MNEMKEFRKSRGLTQKRCGQLLGVSTRAVQSVECGDIKLSDRMKARMQSQWTTESREAFINRMVAEYREKLERTLPKT